MSRFSTVYKSEGGPIISAINSQVLPKLHLGSERADLGFERAEIREVLNKEKQYLRFQVRNCLVPPADCFIL